MSEEADPDTRPKLSLFGLAAFVLLLGGIALLLVGTHNKNEAPFTAVQVHPKLVSLRLVDADGPQLGVHLDGRIAVDRASAPDATYAVIVVDNRRHRIIPSTGTDSGWDQAAASLRERYGWQPSQLDRAAWFEPGAAATLSFDARLPEAALPVTDLGSDLSVVLALTHSSDHVYWAVKLK